MSEDEQSREPTLDPPDVTVRNSRAGESRFGRRIYEIGMVSRTEITGRVRVYRSGIRSWSRLAVDHCCGILGFRKRWDDVGDDHMWPSTGMPHELGAGTHDPRS